jgi:hypothetical protein
MWRPRRPFGAFILRYLNAAGSLHSFKYGIEGIARPYPNAMGFGHLGVSATFPVFGYGG